MKLQICIFLIVSTSIIGCITQSQVDKLDIDTRVLYPYAEHNKWGFTVESGNVVIQPQFDSVSFYSDGLSVVKQNGKFGYLNKNGEWHIKPKYHSANNFLNKATVVIKGSRKYCINQKGRRVKCKTPTIIGMCGNGMLSSSDPSKYVTKKNGKYELLINYWLVDIEGNQTEIPDTSDVGIDTVYRFSREYILLEKDKKYALYKCMGYESEIYGTVDVESFSDRDTTRLDGRLEFVYDEVNYGSNSKRNLYGIEVTHATVRIKDKWGVIDKTGKPLIPIAYHSVQIHNDNLALVEYQHNRKGYREFNQYNYNGDKVTGREFFVR